MVHLKPSMDLDRLQQTLTLVLDHVMRVNPQIDYRLVGTGAALLHGVRLPAADIDILVRERSDVDAFGAALAPFTCLESPAWLPEMRQYYANYKVNGIEVGISTVEVDSDADTVETFGRGPWEHYVLLPCGSYQVPTVALELRLMTELYRNRPDRIDPIVAFLQVNGCDLDLVRRGIAGIGLSQAVQDDVLRRLTL